MKNLKLGLVPKFLHVRLGTMFLLAIIFLLSAFCDMGSVYYSSYEKVIPKRLLGKGSEDPGEKVSYMLFMQGQKQLVHLKVKRDYFVNDFPVYSYHNGMPRQEMPFLAQDCHYEGYIEGAPGSFVSVNICSGLRGILIKAETSYSIEPMLSSKGFEHVLYTMARQPRVSCSVTSKDSQEVASQQQRSRKPLDLQVLSYLWSHTKYVEMFIVVNHQRFHMWGSNMSVTVQAVVDIIALANSFTRGINTVVVLMGMEIWTEGDLIEVPVDLPITLRNFNRWREEQLLNRARHDVAHMIIGHHPGANSGQAFLNGACSSGFAAAVESFHHEDVLLFAALMVHELGHNLGIQHDLPACLCKDRHFCLMHENITKESGFSNCSSVYFHRFLQDHKGACLFNKPWSQSHQSRKRREAQCGNGVVEAGEECDCGSDCENNNCCEENCHLKETAQCSNEPCCSRCQFKTKGQTCRHANGECDLPEYCTGTSATCPENRLVQDGSKCHGSFLCSHGQCMDPNYQCSLLFGYSSRAAPIECYSSLNGKGNRFGNCGISSESPRTYAKCSENNTLCGKLICTEATFLPPIKDKYILIQVPLDLEWCWSMAALDLTDSPDEGHVQNGTFCAPGKACEKYFCEDIVVLESSCDPERSCSGHGICNDLGNCHCLPGFAPPDCKDKGDGGSVDSGPPIMPSVKPPDVDAGQNDSKESTEELAIKLKLLVIAIVLSLIVLLMAICAMIVHSESLEHLEALPEDREKVPEQGLAEKEEEK
ncbi:disintegrin and metalloproteinase domain-containing protein 1b-like, partial [Nannospalax galili]|uniref:disintegrin and metalloproteinase domain-containing protein 1b-like n=1 Tax=Nannospalax galili TaxID=1026970 RepID=UPI0004ED621F